MSCYDETTCFTAEWDIVNFSLFSSAEKNPVRSPVFKTETTHRDSILWRLLVYYSDSEVRFTLVVYDDGWWEKGMCELSLLTTFGQVKLAQTRSTENKNLVYSIKKDEIFGCKRPSFLLQDTLTIHIGIQHHEIKHGRSKFQTVLQTVNLAWNIENFNCSTYIYRALHQQGSLQLVTLLYAVSATENGPHKLRIETLPNSEGYPTFVNCKLLIQDHCGQSLSSDFINPSTGWLWNIQFFYFTYYLSLDLECLIAIEKNFQPLSSTSATLNVDSIPRDASGEARSSSTHQEDFLFLYREGLHTDATLNTEQKSFPVHKNILSARSEVFRAMFETDQTTEAISGIVKIEDIDCKTMENLMVFLYGDKLQDMQWEEVSTLYYAADKYAIHSLKKRCVDLLKDGVTVSNVCHLLVLAENHSDDQLINAAVEFIREHDEVISSTEWAQLEDNNSKLTIKVLRELYLMQRKTKTKVISDTNIIHT